MKRDPTKMPENPEERTEDEFRRRMRARVAKIARAAEDLERAKKKVNALVLAVAFMILIYILIVIYFLT